MAQDTLLGFPAHTLPYRCGKFITLSTASATRFFAKRVAFIVFSTRFSKRTKKAASPYHLSVRHRQIRMAA